MVIFRLIILAHIGFRLFDDAGILKFSNDDTILALCKQYSKIWICGKWNITLPAN